MKFLTVFVALLSVAFGYQASWSLDQLSHALQDPATDPSLVPYLEQALNTMVDALFNGQQVTAVTITIPAVDLSTWSLHQLSEAIQNPTTDPALVPYLETALNQMMQSIFQEQPLEVAPVVIPAMEVTCWSLPELTAALNDPTTNPELIPYLEHAINEIVHALMSGQQMESIVVAVPAGLLPVDTPVAAPVVPVAPIETPDAPIGAPVVEVSPSVPNPAPTPAPTPTPTPASPASPLVQIIVNVNAQGSPAAPAPVAVPEPTPESVDIVEVVEPQEPVPSPGQVNPIDVIAVSPPIINPVDLLHPVGVITPVAVGGHDVGPIV